MQRVFQRPWNACVSVGLQLLASVVWFQHSYVTQFDKNIFFSDRSLVLSTQLY